MGPIEDKWALIVGISKFEDSSIDLKYAAKDASDFRDFLVREAHFAPDHVKLLLDRDATRERILSLLGDKFLPRAALPDDLVVIYISTHGSPSSADIKGLNFIVAHNTSKDDLYATGIPIQDLTRMVRERVHAGRVALILDACHSGVADPERKGLYRQANFDAERIAEETGQLVICSSEPQQVSWESRNYQNSVFTHHLIDALRDRSAQTTIADAFQLLKKRVQQEVLNERGELQTPVLRSSWDSQKLTFSTIPANPRPAPQEPEMLIQHRELGDLNGIAKVSDRDPSKKAYDPSKGISGLWESNWGQTAFFHDPIVDDKPVSVTGYWQQSKTHRGIIKKGTYDPKSRVFSGWYYQGWNLVHGKATLKLEPDGKTMRGEQVHLGFVWKFPWLLWRTAESKESER